eukprot:m.53175 g.53175  ORF g.53175 m.53175 type:complete len:302 (-) comp6742_c0_seq1:102-1007(-)
MTRRPTRPSRSLLATATRPGVCSMLCLDTELSSLSLRAELTLSGEAVAAGAAATASASSSYSPSWSTEGSGESEALLLATAEPRLLPLSSVVTLWASSVLIGGTPRLVPSVMSGFSSTTGDSWGVASNSTLTGDRVDCSLRGRDGPYATALRDLELSSEGVGLAARLRFSRVSERGRAPLGKEMRNSGGATLICGRRSLSFGSGVNPMLWKKMLGGAITGLLTGPSASAWLLAGSCGESGEPASAWGTASSTAASNGPADPPGVGSMGEAASTSIAQVWVGCAVATEPSQQPGSAAASRGC